ncbi:putative sugar O-methyltransferase [Bradyrhizobium monzae]|uniref:putative sugar O-methyltransferase n=1 Tax=Bradyrhizobium sp. Oc8 TaxID=2876780 RepID=UPI001F404A08|nr:putative sugar O-methyltransferase [Bradyrhizobium sp. Oc8]
MRRLIARSSTEEAPPAKPNLEHFAWLLNGAPSAPPAPLVYSPSADPADDLPLVARVMESYKQSFGRHRPASDSMWERDLTIIKKEIHDALSGSDIQKAARLLRNPAETTFFWGFDAIAKAPPGSVEPHENVIKQLNKSEDWKSLYSLWLMNGLTSVAEALGTRRVPYLETDPQQVGLHEKAAQSTDQVLDQIEAALGVNLEFPNPFPGELGLPSSRGIVGFRSVHAIYQAWRIAQIAKQRSGFRVLEIGAGLGRTAYFANLLGVKDYTIVDIPLTNAAQAYFLGRVLGPNFIRLSGEQESAHIKIMSACDIGPSAGHFDLIVNIDSWTEMSRDTAEAYWDFARSATNAVLSINHEHNGFTVRDLYSKDAAVTATRFPYWTRRGYVEEYLTW